MRPYILPSKYGKSKSIMEKRKKNNSTDLTSFGFVEKPNTAMLVLEVADMDLVSYLHDGPPTSFSRRRDNQQIFLTDHSGSRPLSPEKELPIEIQAGEYTAARLC
jgi:hypothetical protein